MELELGLALPAAPAAGLGFDLNGGDDGPAAAAVRSAKRAFADAFGGDGDGDARPTLPLFVWDSPDGDTATDKAAVGAVKAEFNGGCIVTAPVGWPPVKSSWRSSGGARYVKVKMEGVAIGRKVDLSLHRSYATLLDALDRLFARQHGEEGAPAGGHGGGGTAAPPAGNRRDRMFAYQVGGGDWMLLGDAPWGTFVKSVKRLKIVSFFRE